MATLSELPLRWQVFLRTYRWRTGANLSFMGSITAPGRLIQETAPEAAAILLRDQVDLALLVPV